MGESPQEKDLEKTHDTYKTGKKVIKNKLYTFSVLSNQSVCNSLQTYIKGQ